MPFLLCFLTFRGSCEESLPARLDPANALKGKVRGSYVLASNDNSMHVQFVIINAYNETLDRYEAMLGDVEIILAHIPSFKKTFRLTSLNLIDASKHNSNSGNLTIDPGDSVVSEVSWNFIDDNGIDLRRVLLHYTIDPTCVLFGRHIADPEVFSLRASMEVYLKIATVSAGPIPLTLSHRGKWVDPKICPQIFIH